MVRRGSVGAGAESVWRLREARIDKQRGAVRGRGWMRVGEEGGNEAASAVGVSMSSSSSLAGNGVVVASW